jgi:hypothetical protein
MSHVHKNRSFARQIGENRLGGGWFSRSSARARGPHSDLRRSMRGNACGPTRYDCELGINHVGSGAENVGREPRRESMVVGQEWCSIASLAFN